MSNEGVYSLEQPILRTISFLLSPNLIPGMFKMKNKDISCQFRIILSNFIIIQNSLIFIASGYIWYGKVQILSLQIVLSLQIWPCIIKYISYIKRSHIGTDNRILYFMVNGSEMKLYGAVSVMWGRWWILLIVSRRIHSIWFSSALQHEETITLCAALLGFQTSP